MTLITKNAAKNTKHAKNYKPPLDMIINTKASDKFRSLPIEEREAILEEFRAAFAPVFADLTVDEFIAERHKEEEHEA